ncbi:MAG: hypothetical protein EZS28_021151 [Streblomastix strix]|uniref:Uncharacterized protein n=1 Tax=Streblomastix strix TaxID=222440 RepID=A0A5J4VM31_9EUKA|nr:MAG: hypothetical protein EZS28_021151 [Streblomastix strix]
MQQKVRPEVIHLSDDVNVSQAIRYARKWANLNKGPGIIYPASQVNPYSRGTNQNYWEFVNVQKGKTLQDVQPDVGVNSIINKVGAEEHPDIQILDTNKPLHPDKPQLHEANTKREKVIFTFGKQTHPSGISPIIGALKAGLKACGKTLEIVGIGLSFADKAQSSQIDRPEVILKEAATFCDGFPGGATGAAIGSCIFPGIGTVIGGLIGSHLWSSVDEKVVGQAKTCGISLSSDLKVDMLSKLQFNLPTIDTVYLDETGKLVLMSDQQQDQTVSRIENVTSEDFLLALAIALSGQSISFSLDPWDPQQPDGPYYQKVFYPDILRGTLFGETLFQTDYDMKKLAFGLLQVPGLTSELTFRLNEQNSGLSRHRLWIVSDNIQMNVSHSESGQQLEFGQCQMRVCYKELQIDPTSRSGFRDVETSDNKDGYQHKFSTHMTEKYNIIAANHPEYARLQNLAKLFALSKWLVEQGVYIDTELLVSALRQRGVKIPNNISIFDSLGTLDLKMNEQLSQQDPLRAPVDRLTNSESKQTTSTTSEGIRTTTMIVTLSGGIDLQPQCQITELKTPNKPIDPDLMKFIVDSPADQCISITDKNQTVLIPLNFLSEKMVADTIASSAEKFASSDLKKALEIGQDALNTSSQSLKANILMLNTCIQLGLHKDALISCVNAAVLTPDDQKSDEYLKLADQSLNEIWKHPLNPQIRANWVNRFDIYVPDDWIELEISGVDPTLSKIFVSQVMNITTKETPIETLVISEFEQSPNFSTFIELIRSHNTDGEMVSNLYSSFVPGVFAALVNPQLVSASVATVSSTATFIITKILGFANGQHFAYYHLFILPDSTLGHGKKCLFLMISCRDAMTPLMNHWSKELWDLTIKSATRIPQQQILPNQIRNQQDKDSKLQSALVESVHNSGQSKQDAEMTQAISASISERKNPAATKKSKLVKKKKSS